MTRTAQARGPVVERVVVSTTLDPLLSLKALADYSSLSERTLRSYIDLPPSAALPCYRPPAGQSNGGQLGSKILVRKSEFDAWLAQYRSRGRPGLVRALEQLGLGRG